MHASYLLAKGLHKQAHHTHARTPLRRFISHHAPVFRPDEKATPLEVYIQSCMWT